MFFSKHHVGIIKVLKENFYRTPLLMFTQINKMNILILLRVSICIHYFVYYITLGYYEVAAAVYKRRLEFSMGFDVCFFLGLT